MTGAARIAEAAHVGLTTSNCFAIVAAPATCAISYAGVQITIGSALRPVVNVGVDLRFHVSASRAP